MEYDTRQQSFAFPVVGISVATFKLLSRAINATGGIGNLTATINSEYEPSPWIILHQSKVVLAFSIILSIAAGAVATFVVVRLIQFYWVFNGLKFHVPQLALSLDLLACLVIMLHWALDPMYDAALGIDSSCLTLLISDTLAARLCRPSMCLGGLSLRLCR